MAEKNISKEEFAKNYNKFVASLPLKNDVNKYAILHTPAQNKPFKVYKNNSGSIVVQPFTEHASNMVISLTQLSNVIFEGKRNMLA